MQGGIIQGPIEGSVLGGVSPVAGRHGNAIQTNDPDGYVEFPLDSNNKCLQDPDLCSSGVTFSLWLMNLPGNLGALFRVLSSEGCETPGAGFCITIWSGGKVRVIITGSSTFYNYNISPLPINKWQHVMLSFKPNEGLQSYINGCDAAVDQVFPPITNFNPTPISSCFRLGGRKDYARSPNTAHMKFDHILIWYDILNADEIRLLYSRGGIM